MVSEKMVLYRNRNSKRGTTSRVSERIQELRQLLPSCKNAKYRQSKASVLKACIEYIKKLQIEYDRFGKLEDKLKQTILVYRGMLLRVQRLEAIMTMRSLSQDLTDISNKMEVVDEPNTNEDISKAYSHTSSVMDHTTSVNENLHTKTAAQAENQTITEISPVTLGNIYYAGGESSYSPCPVTR